MKTPAEPPAASTASGPRGSVHIELCALSDVGLTREHNEDAFGVTDLTRGSAIDVRASVRLTSGERGVHLMVADGMGGAAAGELASATAVDIVTRHLVDHWTPPAVPATTDDFVSALEMATLEANSVIFRYASQHAEVRGMGTTATIAGVLGDALFLAQVGDSRAYLSRDGSLHQITKDQSLIQKLVEAGEISAEQAEFSERKNIILQALGPEAHIKVDLTRQSLRRGDVLLLCSDGLTGMVRDVIIAKVLREERDLQRACSRLIEYANDGGGADNITVVLARFDGPGLRRASADEPVGHEPYHRVHGAPNDPRNLDALLTERTTAMIRGTPVTPFPAVNPSRVKTARAIRAALTIAAAGILYWLFLTFSR